VFIIAGAAVYLYRRWKGTNADSTVVEKIPPRYETSSESARKRRIREIIARFVGYGLLLRLAFLVLLSRRQRLSKILHGGVSLLLASLVGMLCKGPHQSIATVLFRQLLGVEQVRCDGTVQPGYEEVADAESAPYFTVTLDP